MNFDFSERVQKLPPYVFARINQVKQEEIKKGRKLISLGMGDPDLPAPDFVVERLCAAARNPSNHGYPSYIGSPNFRSAVSSWYARRFNVSLNPESEVMALVGSKEGIGHIPLAFLNPGEAALVPDPGYPAYTAAVQFAGGVVKPFALKQKNHFLPDFSELEKLVKEGPKVRLWYLNYPGNPTAATAPLEFFDEAIRFARKHDILICHDNPYSEIYFDGKAQPSFLQAKGSKEVGVEFHSLSKTFNMAGFRLGMVCGNERIIRGLAQVKSNIDTGVFNACQEAGIDALKKGDAFSAELRAIYQKRRDAILPALREAGLQCETPQATFYLWCRVPAGQNSEEYVMNLIREKGIVGTPGTGFGAAGEGYVRFALCAEIEVLKQVALALKA